MPDLRIGKASLPVEGIRELKADVKLDDTLKSQLMKDGLDEVIFQKGDKLFIAYKTNLDLSRIKLNLDEKTFDENSAYDAGQLSEDGDAVKVLFADDENRESFWVAPYKAIGTGVKELINDPFGKTAIVGFIGGASAVVSSKAGLTGAGMKSIYIGTAVGTSASALKTTSEAVWDYNGPPPAIASFAVGGLGYGLGAAGGHAGFELVKASINNPKVALFSTLSAAALIGTGVVLDALSDNEKPATYRVINKIAN